MSLEKENFKIDEKLKKAYIKSFYGTSDEIYYLIIIATKILRYDFEEKSVQVDIDRLYDEFVYFKYYSEMSNSYLLDFFMPIILVNRSFEHYEKIAKDLAEKLCRFYGFEDRKYQYTIDIFCYDMIIRNMLISKVNMLEILNKIKDELIEFNPYINSKTDNIKFQIEKIRYIEQIHKCIDSYEIDKNEDLYETDIVIIDIFQCIFDKNFFEKYSKKKDYGVISVYNLLFTLNGNSKEVSFNIDIDMKSSIYKNFIEAMSEHILRIRYGKVKLVKYNIKASPKDFLNRELEEEFSDPILNRVKIESRKIVDEGNKKKIILKLSTKTGLYKFEYRLIENS